MPAVSKPLNMTDQVYHKIKEMMFDYKIVPGQRLVFTDLAEKLGVSRTPVNNALSLLAKEGFLDLVPHQGYRVHELTRDEADSLLELRLILELGSLERVLAQMTAKRIKILEKKKNQYEEAALTGVNRGTFILNEDFHYCYMEMAKNVYLLDYFKEINQRVFIRHRVEGYSAERTREVIQEHNQIYEAICRKDLKQARTAIEQHIIAGKEYILSLHS
ncbi:MAG: GntR family transcriptional regulator [Desulfobacteraceae bacterium]|nr:GntR family transcriptional regulator [Desulfobacteraceae bacterium]